jgi:hypothetical protein
LLHTQEVAGSKPAPPTINLLRVRLEVLLPLFESPRTPRNGLEKSHSKSYD